MGPRTFWKIRDRRTGLFVAHKPYYVALKEGEYAATTTVGKTFGRLSGAMNVLGIIAEKIDSTQKFDTWNNTAEQNRYRAWVFETIGPYFELVEYHVYEVGIRTEKGLEVWCLT